jgi:fumarylacetoacetate (FAA) hydrolase
VRLATLKSKAPNNRHGDLVVISSQYSKAVYAHRTEFSTLLHALESWKTAAPRLAELSRELDKGAVNESFDLRLEDCIAPLPQAAGFYDGSAFLSHVVRARRARGDEMPESAKKTPLMYQGVSDNLLAWNAPLEIMDPAFGADFEGEFAAITSDVPKGATAEEATRHIALFTLFNDITYRELIKAELPTLFGFLQSKPNSSFAPIVVTPDELGDAWDGKRLHGALKVFWNGELFGQPSPSEMHFSMGELIAHACRTRPLAAGSIVGTGTISNKDAAKGFACLTEKRFQEILDSGSAKTPWLKAGDTVRIDYTLHGRSVFGVIDQKAV